MDAGRFDRLARSFAAPSSRRTLLAGFVLATTLVPGQAVAKKKKKKCRTCCRANGSLCKKKSAACKPQNCLDPPFTIEANWGTATADHDTFVFVPNEAGATLPAPFIDYSCNPADSGCESDVYPFLCVSQDASGPGDEVTTVRRLLAGTYEYWVELSNPSPAADVAVILRDRGGDSSAPGAAPPTRAGPRRSVGTSSTWTGAPVASPRSTPPSLPICPTARTPRTRSSARGPDPNGPSALRARRPRRRVTKEIRVPPFPPELGLPRGTQHPGRVQQPALGDLRRGAEAGVLGAIG